MDIVPPDVVAAFCSAMWVFCFAITGDSIRFYDADILSRTQQPSTLTLYKSTGRNCY